VLKKPRKEGELIGKQMPPELGVHTAHGQVLAVRVPIAAGRSEREAWESAHLADGATLSSGGGRRAVAEAPDDLRTCFQRDRDRIVHSAAFRRLAGKTQVFIFPSDHQRTRLTHALEVAQVAGAIARACRLNLDLTEAIALGHDCGHGPGGHASEAALSPYLPEGFDHAVWGAEVALAELNLCVETLDGIRNHSWRRPAPATPEAEVVSWADRIAYVCHDFEDAVHAGVVRDDELATSIRSTLGTHRSAQLTTLIEAMVATTTSTGTIGMRADAAAALDEFRAFNYERIYLRPASNDQADRVVRMLRAITEHLLARPGAEATDVRAVVGYVAGMTDRFACDLAVRELGWPTEELPRGIDLAD
jgi:dGTPase